MDEKPKVKAPKWFYAFRDKPTPVKEVIPGLWVVDEPEDLRTEEEWMEEWFKPNPLFSKPFEKKNS